MDVAAYLERRLELEEDGLREEDLARLEAQPADLVLGQLHVLARSRSSHWKGRQANHQTAQFWTGVAKVRGDGSRN